MVPQIIDGKAISEQVKAEVKREVQELASRGVAPGLAAVLVGENPASQLYVKLKGRTCEELGMHSQTHRLSSSIAESDLLGLVDKLNHDDKVHGILVQLPLPEHIREEKILSAISPLKDVDCFHPENVGLLLIGSPRFAPATPSGVQQLLIRSGNSPEGKHVVVLGRSNIVGKPLAALLMQKKPGANATVTICHSGTENLREVTRSGDILVAAMGSPLFVKADMVRDGAVVVDVGINRVEDPKAKQGYKIVGDVDFESVRLKAKAITPVPGGVGPMTIAMLMKNTVAATRLQNP